MLAGYIWDVPPFDGEQLKLPASVRNDAVRGRITSVLERIVRLQEGHFSFHVAQVAPSKVGTRDLALETLEDGINPRGSHAGPRPTDGRGPTRGQRRPRGLAERSFARVEPGGAPRGAGPRRDPGGAVGPAGGRRGRRPAPRRGAALRQRLPGHRGRGCQSRPTRGRPPRRKSGSVRPRHRSGPSLAQRQQLSRWPGGCGVRCDTREGATGPAHRGERRRTPAEHGSEAGRVDAGTEARPFEARPAPIRSRPAGVREEAGSRSHPSPAAASVSLDRRRGGKRSRATS